MEDSNYRVNRLSAKGVREEYDQNELKAPRKILPKK